ncbi:aminotransferase class I/II-fold pyridoxal phosphate-dependent enzyme [Candidatus Dojkabacteria bacterium]|nr:aminotransferase class I/II-fold pyridoxal phosphate-dependent enzyme [Candidatus Dojkabacteria bacterium]
MKKISISWAPNAQKDDIVLALSLLFRPWKWFGNKAVEHLEKKVGDFLDTKAYAFDSARSSLYAILKAFGIGKGDEVLLQAFTCVALPNPILWVGAKPIYVDIDLDNFNIDVDDLEKKITLKTKAVIVQYTFGIVPNLSRIKDICSKHNLILIEDNCHNFGQVFQVDGKRYKAGTFGDAAMISLGQEKIISATRGGFAVVHNKRARIPLEDEYEYLKKPRIRDIIRGILNPCIWKVREKFGFIGDLIYKFLVKIRLHELGLTKEELTGKKANHLPYSMPNSNAILGLKQFGKLEKFIQHRKRVASNYFKVLSNYITVQQDNNMKVSILSNEDARKPVRGIKIVKRNEASRYAPPTWLRFPIVMEDAENVRRDAETKGIILGNWYTEVIHCQGVDMCALNYKEGSCPKAEWLVQRSINLPTHQGIGTDEIRKILEFIMQY